MIKKLFSFISIVFITNILYSSVSTANFGDGTPPIIFNFRIEESEPNRVYFDSDEPISGSNIEGFFISNKSITGITINESQTTNHYIRVSESFTYWDNITIRYEGGGNIKDGDNNYLIDFTLSYIKNNIPEPQTNIDRYVTTGASGGGDGLSEASAWTFKEAFANANAGMTVWVKSGNYGNLNLQIYNDGTSISPIKFIGYKNSIGDITSNYYDYGRTWSDSEMPTFSGNDPTQGIAIQPMGIEYIIFRNLQFKNYSAGIQAQNTNNKYLVFDRLNGHTFGNGSRVGGSVYASFIDFSVQAVNNPLYYHTNAPYTGNDHFKFLDIRVVNASMGNIIAMGDGNHLFDGCKSYSDRVTEPERLDYHITFNGHNNIARNCYAENHNTTRTNVSTHGIGVRSSYNHNKVTDPGSTYNLIEKSTAVNIGEGFYFRNFGANHNVIKDCVVSNNENAVNYLSALHENTGGIFFYGGTDYNTVERVKVSQVTFGVGFIDDSDEDGSPDKSIGKNNIVRNSVFNKTKYAIYAGGDPTVGIMKDNKIINTTFDDARFILTKYTAVVQNLEFRNCIITNVQGVKGLPANPHPEGMSYHNTDFFGNKDNWIEAGNGNINLNPQYVSLNDFHLSSSSPIEVTEGGKQELLSEYDFEGKYRGGKPSMGAYQYGDSPTGSIVVNAGSDVEICQGSETTLTATGNGQFSWNTGETTASITVSPEVTTTYTVTVSDDENSASDEVIVTVNDAPAVNLGEDVTICLGSEAILTAEGVGELLWSTGDISNSITTNPSETTIYTVTASVTCGDEILSVTDSITVIVMPEIVLNAGEDVTICSGDEVILTAEGDQDFLWNTGETTASITVSPSETTTYSVTSSSGDCSVTDEVIVSITELPEVSLGDDISICSGNEVTLSAQGIGEFLWSTGENSESISVNPTETSIYTVTASVTCGGEILSVTDTLIVNVTPGIILNAGEDVVICSGSEITLTAEGNQGFLWSTGETTASITVSPAETTTYSVTSSSGDCTATDNVVVTVGDFPTVNLGEDINICLGNETILTAEGSGDFLWNTGETTSSITVNPSETTIYSVIASSPCSADVSDEIQVNVTPSLTVNAGDDITICSGNEITLTAEGNGGFLWNTGETTASIIVNPDDTTTYTVSSGSGDCMVTDEVIVTVNQLPTLILGDDESICYGEEIVLIAEGFGEFLWSTGETSDRIRVNPLVTTTYSVSVSNSCGTSVTDEITVNVGQQITVNAGEDETICTGESVTLIAEGNGDFLWSTGETTPSITVSPNTPTLYWVTSTIGDCSLSDDVYVLVENAPSVSLGEDKTICSGDNITLVAEGIGDFLWSTGETTSSILVKPNETTTYSVTASSSCSASDTDELTVFVNNGVIANAGNDISIIQGEKITLTASGGSLFLWNTGETTASIDVQPTETTIYTVEVSNEEGSCIDSDDVKVTIENIPLTINSGEPEITICLGDEITLLGRGGINYLWNTKDISSSIIVKPEETTTYYVSALINNVLETTEVTIIVEDCSTFKKEEFNIYPNPSKGLVNIHLPSQKTKLKLSVISLKGELVLVKEVKADNNKGVFTQIDLSRIARGMYLLNMSNDSFNETKKIIIN